jgi:sugar phosphate isomerase/epimerase
VKIPAGAEVVDLAGKALLPGLVDMHTHLDETGGLLNIASGVTTIRSLGGGIDIMGDLKTRMDSGAIVGPHIVRFGIIEGRGPKAIHVKVTATTPDEAKAAVEKYAALGYHGIKIYNSVPADIVPVLTKHAHARGMQVTGHVPVFMIAEDVVKAGYDGIEHMNQVFLNFVGTRETDTRDLMRFTLVGENGASVDLKSKRVRDFFALLRKHRVVVDPTFVVFQNKMLPSAAGAPLQGQERVLSRLPALTARSVMRDGFPIGDKADQYRASWKRMLEMAKAMHDAQIHVVLGTDTIQGLMLHHEMKLFAEAGFANATILELATLGAARAMKLDKTFGSITKGKRADLVVIDGDPLAKLDDIERVVTTMRGGVVYVSAPLSEAVGVTP